MAKANEHAKTTLQQELPSSDEQFWSEAGENDQPFSAYGATESKRGTLIGSSAESQDATRMSPDHNITSDPMDDSQGSTDEYEQSLEGQDDFVSRESDKYTDLDDEQGTSSEEPDAADLAAAEQLRWDRPHNNAFNEPDVVALSEAAELAFDPPVEPSSQRNTGSAERNSATTVSQKIDLNAPLFPVEEADENLDQDEHENENENNATPSFKEFDLPQSLEEASIRLGDPNLMLAAGEEYTSEKRRTEEENAESENLDFTESNYSPDLQPSGPELTMSEPQIREFSQNENTNSRTRTKVPSSFESFATESLPETGQSKGYDADPENFAKLALAAFSESGNETDATHDARPQDSFADPLHGAEEFVAIIESKNTKTREVRFTEEEFARAEQQILENRQVHISGKALVLDAIAITRQIPSDGSRRRRRSSSI